MQHTDLNKSFEASIASPLTELAKDYSEIALDSILNEGILRDIPVVGTLLGMAKMVGGIREAFTLKKIATFLFRLKDVPQSEREAFLEKLQHENIRNEVAEKCLVLLDRYDDVEKALILGNLFIAYMRGLLDNQEFLKLSSIVDKVYIRDLQVYCKSTMYNPNERERDYWQSKESAYITKALVSFGLYWEEIDMDEQSIRNIISDGYNQVKFKHNVSALGRKLMRYGYGYSTG